MKKIISLLVVLAMLIAVVPAVFADDAATYTKISSMEELTDGQYVMVVSNGYAPYVYSSGWVTNAQPTVDGNKVTNDAGAVWTIDVSDDGATVTLTDSNGVTIAPKGGNNNGIKDATYAWAVSCTDGTFSFAGQGTDTVTLACNTDATNGLNRFRGYKNATVTGSYASSYLTAFSLYKLDEAPAATPLVDGDNTITIAQGTTEGKYTYEATQDGTLYITYTSYVYDYNGEYGSWRTVCDDYIDQQMGSDCQTMMTVNGTELTDHYYGSVEVKAGDKLDLVWTVVNEYMASSCANYSYSAVLNLNYEKNALPEPGSEKLPVELSYAECPTQTIEIAAGATAYYNLFYDFNGTTFTVTGEGAYILMPAYNDWGWPIYDDEGNMTWNRYDAVDGVVSVEIKSYGETLQIGNDGSTAATFGISAEYIEGTYNNPATIVNGENVGEYEGASYYFDYTADCDTTLTLSISSSTDSWAINYYNADYSITGYYTSADEEVVSTYELVIPMGETYTIVVWAADYSPATITLDATIDCPHDYVDNVCTICGSVAEVYYENVADIDDDFSLTLDKNETADYVDITEEHTVVLGEDGYYHLDSADGAIVYVDLDYVWSFADPINSTTGSGQVYLYVYDENGALTKYENGNYVKYNATAAIQEYLDAADENGYYPLTADLVYFYQSYGTSQGWYTPGMSFLASAELIPADFVAETAWMFACFTVAETPENSIPTTGDTTISLVAAAALVSAMSIIALPKVKKFF